MNDAQTSALDEAPGDSENIRRVKALYRALKAKDQAKLRSLLVDEPFWDVCPGFPDGGVYRGMEQVFGGFYRRLMSQVHAFGAFPERFVDGGDTVVALGAYRVVRSEGGVPATVRFCHAWPVAADGRLTGVWQVADSAQFPAAV